MSTPTGASSDGSAESDCGMVPKVATLDASPLDECEEGLENENCAGEGSFVTDHSIAINILELGFSGLQSSHQDSRCWLSYHLEDALHKVCHPSTARLLLSQALCPHFFQALCYV